MTSFYDKLQQIFGSAQMIDLHIHDMLDFSVLSMKRENFAAKIEKFDVRDAFDFIALIF